MTTTPATTAQPGMLTVDEFRSVLPDKMKKSISPEVLKTLNDMLSDPDMAEAFRDNIIGYTHVMKEGKFKLDNYLHASKYVTYKLMGLNNTEAYTRTFPSKIQRWTQQGVANKDMASYITSYNKSKLVNLIMEQALIPCHVLNADIKQKAINHLFHLMQNAQSEKVQQESANSLLTHLKSPEKTELKIDVSDRAADAIDIMRQNAEALARLQQEMIAGKQMSAKDVAERNMDFGEVIEGEIIE